MAFGAKKAYDKQTGIAPVKKKQYIVNSSLVATPLCRWSISAFGSGRSAALNISYSYVWEPVPCGAGLLCQSGLLPRANGGRPCKCGQPLWSSPDIHALCSWLPELWTEQELPLYYIGASVILYRRSLAYTSCSTCMALQEWKLVIPIVYFRSR